MRRARPSTGRWRRCGNTGRSMLYMSRAAGNSRRPGLYFSGSCAMLGPRNKREARLRRRSRPRIAAGPADSRVFASLRRSGAAVFQHTYGVLGIPPRRSPYSRFCSEPGREGRPWESSIKRAPPWPGTWGFPYAPCMPSVTGFQPTTTGRRFPSGTAERGCSGCRTLCSRTSSGASPGCCSQACPCRPMPPPTDTARGWWRMPGGMWAAPSC